MVTKIQYNTIRLIRTKINKYKNNKKFNILSIRPKKYYKIQINKYINYYTYYHTYNMCKFMSDVQLATYASRNR